MKIPRSRVSKANKLSQQLVLHKILTLFEFKGEAIRTHSSYHVTVRALATVTSSVFLNIWLSVESYLII